MLHVSLSKALSKILKGTNHVIIYSGSGKNQAVVSKVFVFTKGKRSRISGRSTHRENLIASRIRSYEKQLQLMNKKLSQLDKNSRLGKCYSRQIKAYENIIEKLKRKIQ
jgi:predicted RNase H-like nuclease (RuvC/YqgF family)